MLNRRVESCRTAWLATSAGGVFGVWDVLAWVCAAMLSIANVVEDSSCIDPKKWCIKNVFRGDSCILL